MSWLGDIFGGIPIVGPLVNDIFGLETDDERRSRAAMDQAQGLSDMIAGMSRDWYNQTSPLRSSIVSRAQDILQGNFDPTGSPIYPSLRQGAEDVYGRARENILANAPAGGTLQGALSDLEGSKARGLTDIMAQILQNEFTNSWNLGTSSVPTSLQGASAASAPLGAANQALGMNMNAGRQGYSLNNLGSSIFGSMGQGMGANFADPMSAIVSKWAFPIM